MFIHNLGQFENVVVACFEIPVLVVCFERFFLLDWYDLSPYLITLTFNQPIRENLLFNTFGNLVKYFEVIVVFVSFLE